MPPPDTTTPPHEPLIRIPEFDTEEFSRILSSITLVSQTSAAFYEILDACDELFHAPEHSYSVELPWLAGPRPYMISPRLIAMETLTYFGICVKTAPSQDIVIYTLSEPLGTDFVSHLAAMTTSVREVALRRGTEVKMYIRYLMQSRVMNKPPMEYGHLQYVQRDLQALLQLIRAELAFYLIDDTDPENWN